jgi:hypothetical protein
MRRRERVLKKQEEKRAGFSFVIFRSLTTDKSCESCGKLFKNPLFLWGKDIRYSIRFTTLL